MPAKQSRWDAPCRTASIRRRHLHPRMLHGTAGGDAPTAGCGSAAERQENAEREGDGGQSRGEGQGSRASSVPARSRQRRSAAAAFRSWLGWCVSAQLRRTMIALCAHQQSARRCRCNEAVRARARQMWRANQPSAVACVLHEAALAPPLARRGSCCGSPSHLRAAGCALLPAGFGICADAASKRAAEIRDGA